MRFIAPHRQREQMKRGHDGPEHERILPFRDSEMIETTTAGENQAWHTGLL